MPTEGPTGNSFRGTQGARAFFDGLAPTYSEAHGDAERLLAYRLRRLHRAARFEPTDRVLEMGCGPAQHLLGILPYIAEGVGIDLSERMIEVAQERSSRPAGATKRLSLVTDDARDMRSQPDSAFEAAFSVGMLEHVPEKQRVMDEAYRVLKPRGRLVIMTVNADYLWYRHMARFFGGPIRHLPTDELVSAGALSRLALRAGFEAIRVDTWRFIPRGDMPRALAPFFSALDVLGVAAGSRNLRGGLLVSARKPVSAEASR